MILKYIFRNIGTKKLLTFIIVLSVTIASAVLFASSSFTSTIESMSEERLRQYYGITDIIIKPQIDQEERFFSDYKAKALGSQLDYVITAIEDSGLFQYQHNESIQLNLLAVDYENFLLMNQIYYKEKLFNDNFSGQSIIISDKTAKKYNVQLGDTIKVFISDTPYLLTVVGIAQSNHFFSEDGSVPIVLVPKELMEAKYNIRGKGNIIFIKTANSKELRKVLEILQKEYKKQTVKEPISTEEIQQQIGGIVTTFLLMTIVVSLMSIAVIYSSFKVVVMERIKVMGTFRSLGATQQTTAIILLFETFIYGVLGGILGCFLGMLILYGMSAIMSTNPGEQAVNIHFSYITIGITVLMAIVISCISTLLPILQVSKLTIKEIMFGQINKKASTTLKIWKGIFGGLLIVLSLIIPKVLSQKTALISNSILLVGIVIGMVFISPFGTHLFVKLNEWFIFRVLGSEGQLAMRNVRSDSNMMTNISLLTIAVSILLMINIVGYGVSKEIVEFYSKVPRFDIYFTAEEMDRNTLIEIKSVEGVQSAYGTYYSTNVYVDEWGQALGTIEGINVTNYLEYWNIDMLGFEDDMKTLLDTGRYIIVSTMIRDKFEIEKGDILTFKMGSVARKYEVIGFMNTSREKGNFGIVSERYLKQDMKLQYYTHILIKTNDNQEQLEVALKKRFVNMEPQILTLNEISKTDAENSTSQLLILKGFVFLALCIGVLSVSNNLVISYLQRQRTLAMLSSIGMGKAQIRKMLFLESISIGIVGSILGIVGGVLMLRLIPAILFAINQRIVIYYPIKEVVLGFFMGILITLISCVGPTLRLSKMNIVEQIKTE